MSYLLKSLFWQTNDNTLLITAFFQLNQDLIADREVIYPPSKPPTPLIQEQSATSQEENDPAEQNINNSATTSDEAVSDTGDNGTQCLSINSKSAN